MQTHIIDRRPDQGEQREAIAAVNADARENWFDPEWQRAMTADLNETIFEGFAHENLIDVLADVDRVGMDERISVEEVRGLEAYWVSEGGQIDSSTMTENVWELRRDLVGFQVDEFEDKIRSNFARYSSQLASLGIQRLDAAVNSRVLRLYQAVISGASPYLIQTAGVSLPALDTAIDEVADETDDGEVVIVGRAVMVNQITSELAATGLYIPETNEEIIRTGRVGRYRGATIARLVNHKDANGKSFVPGNEMYIAGRNAARVGFWGGLETKTWSDADGGDYFHLKSKLRTGAAVHRPERVRRYVDTARPA